MNSTARFTVGDLSCNATDACERDGFFEKETVIGDESCSESFTSCSTSSFISCSHAACYFHQTGSCPVKIIGRTLSWEWDLAISERVAWVYGEISQVGTLYTIAIFHCKCLCPLNFFPLILVFDGGCNGVNACMTSDTVTVSGEVKLEVGSNSCNAQFACSNQQGGDLKISEDSCNGDHSW